MAKACSNVFAPFDHTSFKAPDSQSSKEALTYALLETVRLVLEGQESEEDEKHQAVLDHHASSEHTSSDVYTEPAPPPRLIAKKPQPKSGVLGGPCAHCGATESPQWRRPLTKKVVLCNACGIYYSRHHSLPKRKKAPGLRHTTLEDIESKAADSCGELDSTVEVHGRGHGQVGRGATPAMDAMACDGPTTSAAPSAVAQDSIVSEAQMLQLRPILTQRLSHQEAASTAPAAAQPDDAARAGSGAGVAHTPTQSASMAACASPMAAHSVSMACMSPTASCGSPVHYSSGIAAPPSTPKRKDDQIDALFDAHEESLAKRAMKRAAAAAMTAAAASNAAAAAAVSSTPAASTGTSTPAGEQSAGGAFDPANANFYIAPPQGGPVGGMGRRPILTASLAATMGMQMPPGMQPGQQGGAAFGAPAMVGVPMQGIPRMSLIEALLHQQSQSRFANAAQVSNAAAMHAFSALPGILMTTGATAFHPQAPAFSTLRPVTTALCEQSGDSGAGSGVQLPVRNCRAPRSKTSSRPGSPVCGRSRS